MIEIIGLLILANFLTYSFWLIIKEYKQTQDVISIEPCMPEGQTIEQQLQKIDDEFQELSTATDYHNLAEESLDVSRTGFGMFNLSVEKIAEDSDLDKQYIKRKLIQEHYEKLEERRKEWNEQSEIGQESTE